MGIWDIEGTRIGVRICFEVRFPEYFRELYRQKAEVVIISFCDVSEEPNEARLDLIRSHLVTRAVENVCYVVSVNSARPNQTAPTCVIGPEGDVRVEAPRDTESVIVYDLVATDGGRGRKGRRHYSDLLTGSEG